jgi:hypothetical protein
MTILAGKQSDEISEIRGIGRSKTTTVYMGMSARHPEGRDADFLEWHTMDHRPMQYRLATVQASMRVVSTPECRAARAMNDPRYSDVDHVMTYLFSDITGLDEFHSLNKALEQAGRYPEHLPEIEMGICTFQNAQAAPRAKVGSEVLPWWPARGVYLLVEQGETPVTNLLEVPGVVGLWSMTGTKAEPPFTSTSGLQITYCLLDEDPVATAQLLRRPLEERWKNTGVAPLLAAPFHPVVPYEWRRFLP